MNRARTREREMQNPGTSATPLSHPKCRVQSYFPSAHPLETYPLHAHCSEMTRRTCMAVPVLLLVFHHHDHPKHRLHSKFLEACSFTQYKFTIDA